MSQVSIRASNLLIVVFSHELWYSYQMPKSGEHSYPVKLKNGAYISNNTSGLAFGTSSAEFTSEKILAIQTSLNALMERLGGRKFLGEERKVGRGHYTSHTKRGWLVRKVEVDESRNYYQDDAQFYRGMVLGDLVVAALVTNGEIISGDLTSGDSLGTRVTDDALAALVYPDFWTGRLQPDGSNIYEESPSYLVNALGISPEDLKDSVLMVPIVGRFKGENINPRRFRIAVAEGYWLAQPPFTLDDLTDACVTDIEQWSGINVRQLQEEASQKEKELHVSEKITFGNK